MPQRITPDEVNALRARITEALKGEPPRGSRKRMALRCAFGESNYSAFMNGSRGASLLTLQKVDAAIASLAGSGPLAPVPKIAPGRNRLGGGGFHGSYASATEAKAIRAEISKSVPGRWRSVRAFLNAAGVPRKSESSWYGIITSRRPMTIASSTRLRAALDGKPPPSSNGAPVTPYSSELATAPLDLRARAPRAGKFVLAALRTNAGHVLSSRFGGNVPALAKAVGVTAHRLSAFLDGRALTLEESTGVADRLTALSQGAETAHPAPGVTMVKASAHGVSIEAWRQGEANGAGSHDPPEVRAKRFVLEHGAEAIAIVLELAKGEMS